MVTFDGSTFTTRTLRLPEGEVMTADTSFGLSAHASTGPSHSYEGPRTDVYVNWYGGVAAALTPEAAMAAAVLAEEAGIE